MKKYIAVLVSFLMAVILSGCACEHQWTEADCLNPQVCSNCEETSGEALGHDWMSASCIAPETCSRCSETQGEPLAHSFGAWHIGETEMTHGCELCGLEESAELDPAVVLEVLLAGHWEFHSIFRDGTYYSANQLETPGDHIYFEEGRSFRGLLNQEEYTGTWEFVEYIEKDGSTLYRFLTTGEDGRTMEMRLLPREDQNALFAIYANETQVLMTQNTAVAEGIIGTWVDQEDYENGLSITFREDRTLSWVLDEELEGTWQLTPLVDYGTMQYYGLRITLDKDGEPTYLDGAAVYYGTVSGAPHVISVNWNAENIEHLSTGLIPKR